MTALTFWIAFVAVASTLIRRSRARRREFRAQMSRFISTPRLVLGMRRGSLTIAQPVRGRVPLDAWDQASIQANKSRIYSAHHS